MTEQSDMARRPMVNLDGRTAIITGSGKGIGAAVAKCLASHGAAVVINYVHDAASAQRTVKDIHSLGGLAIAVQADVCDESQSSKLVGTAVDSFGGVDILVNNAFGRFSFDPRRRSTFAGGDWDEFSAQIEGCLHGAYLMCSHVVPLMRAQTSGRIINISSNLVDSPIVPYHSYITAKGGLVGMTRSLAQELGHPVRRSELAVQVIRALDRMYAAFPQGKQEYLDKYRADCLTPGNQVQLITPVSRREAKAVAIDDEFRLVVEYPDGSREALSAGEVSVRGMYGYV